MDNIHCIFSSELFLETPNLTASEYEYEFEKNVKKPMAVIHFLGKNNTIHCCFSCFLTFFLVMF